VGVDICRDRTGKELSEVTVLTETGICTLIRINVLGVVQPLSE